MPRCARCGCPNEQQHPDPHGLGLCHTHNTQFTQGTIGKNHNPRQKTTPTHQAHKLLTTARQPGETNRALARRLKIPKDIVYHITAETWPIIQSHTWEYLQDAIADAQYHTNKTGTQLPLFTVENQPPTNHPRAS